jgi:hypothetical protein
MAVLAGISLLAAGAVAQEERPQIAPGERKVGKKEVGPRALALLQLGEKGKAALVPIAILVDGKFWDASEYKAAPVPMALDTGTVYEVEKAGSSQGLFTVSSALHSNSPSVANPWIGTGDWVPAGSEKPKTAMKAESVPVGLEPTDGPPRLKKSASAPASTPAPASSPSSSQTQTPAGGSGSDKPGSGQPSSGSTTPSSTGTGSTAPNSTASAPPASKPGDASSSAPKSTEPKSSDSKSGAAKPSQANVPVSDSGAGGGDRPRLRRGKPTGPLPDDDIPGYSKPGAEPAAGASTTAAVSAAGVSATTPSTAATAAPVQLIPAISDTSGPEPRSYSYDWLKGEESDRLKQMTALAKTQLRAYLVAQAKARIGVPATQAQSARRKAAAKPPDPVFENVKMTAYDLWTNGQPVLVLSAEAYVPPPTGFTETITDTGMKYSIMLVARPDLYNNLGNLYVGITDKYHLDLTPRLDLIDVVDADGDGRGELLFRETSDVGNGYAIYRVGADKLWKMFDTLNAE